MRNEKWEMRNADEDDEDDNEDDEEDEDEEENRDDDDDDDGGGGDGDDGDDGGNVFGYSQSRNNSRTLSPHKYLRIWRLLNLEDEMLASGDSIGLVYIWDIAAWHCEAWA